MTEVDRRQSKVVDIGPVRLELPSPIRSFKPNTSCNRKPHWPTLT